MNIGVDTRQGHIKEVWFNLFQWPTWCTNF